MGEVYGVRLVVRLGVDFSIRYNFIQEGISSVEDSTFDTSSRMQVSAGHRCIEVKYSSFKPIGGEELSRVKKEMKLRILSIMDDYRKFLIKQDTFNSSLAIG